MNILLKKNLNNNIFLIWTSIIFFVYIFFPVNSGVYDDIYNLLDLIIVIPGIITIVYRIVKNKDKIITSNFDVILSLFYVSMYLPIIFNKEISLSTSLYYNLNYFKWLILYFLFKLFFIDKENTYKLI